MADGNREPVRTVTSKVLAILEAFEKSRGALSLTDVAEKSGLPLSPAHRLVNELTDWGFLSREPNGRYQLGIRLWELAQMRISREEIFGPVICILKYDDAGGSADEAVALANNTEFGLGGLVFGGDPDTALAVADRMDTGSVGINFFASNHAAPFGGRHDSGLGTEYGIEGLNAYLSYKSIHRKV